MYKEYKYAEKTFLRILEKLQSEMKILLRGSKWYDIKIQGFESYIQQNLYSRDLSCLYTVNSRFMSVRFYSFYVRSSPTPNWGDSR